MRNLYLVIFIFIVSNCYGQKLTRQQQLEFADDLVFNKHQPVDLISDVNFVHQKLKENHPNLYWYIKKSQLDKKFDSLKRSLNEPLTSMQFRAGLMSVLSAIGDGHIAITSDLRSIDSLVGNDAIRIINGQRSKPLPLSIKILGNKIYVSSNQSDNNAVTVGGEIIEIDGHTSTTIIKNLESSLASDGYNASFKANLLNRNPDLFDHIFSANYKVEDVVKFVIKQNDQLKTYILKTVKEIPNEVKNADLYEDMYTIYNTGPLAYIKIYTLLSKDRNKDFSKFFKEVYDKKIDKMVIDLRDNAGGNITIQKKIFSYLIDQKTPYLDKKSNAYTTKDFKRFLATNNLTESAYENDFEPVKPADSLNFKGKVYLLINSGSFSGASMLPANLKGNKNVILVGSETGGGANGCTAMIYDNLIMPTSKLTLHYGLVAVKNAKQVKAKGHGVMPDVEIKYTLQDYLDKKDLEMNWIFNEVEKN